MRVAGIAVTPPAFKASGGVSAGLQLMRSVAQHCETRMLVMAERDEEATDGNLAVSWVRATNVLTPLRRILPRAAMTLMWRADFGRWLRTVRPDIVHLHNPHPPGAFLAAARECRRLGVPYVVSTHGFVEFDDYSKGFELASWKRPLLQRLVRDPVVEVALGAAQILMLSPMEKPILVGMGVPGQRLRVVPNGIDRYYFERLPAAELERLTSRFRLPPGRPLLLFVGNHTANKGIDILLGAARLMRAEATVVVCGAIRSAEEHALLLRSSGFALPDPRVLFTDFTTKDELRALYQKADLFVFPSRADTLPLVILEAMASGLPVVATTVGGIPYQVTPDTGSLVPPSDAPALACAIDEMLASPERRALMGAAGRLRVSETFDWERSAELAVSAYAEVLGVAGA